MWNRTIGIGLALGFAALPLSCGGDDDDSPGGNGGSAGKGGSAGNGGVGGSAGKGGAGGVAGKGGAGGVAGKGGGSGMSGRGGGGGAGTGGSTGGSGGTDGGTSAAGAGGEPEVNECDANPCDHGGLCTSAAGTFSCNCSGTGYTGTTCQTTCPGQANFSGGEAGDSGAGGEGTGGTFSSGGTGGVAVTGGSSGLGGSGGSGTSTVACDSVFVVGPDGFVRAPTSGCPCWHGYASAAIGASDTESVVMPTSFAMCGSGCLLRASGTVGSATELNSYAGVVFLGFNLNQPVGSSAKGTIVPTGSGLAVSYVNAGSSPLVRVQISAGTTRWCAELTTSGATIPYGMFNTQCWEGGMGTAYAMSPIDTLQIVIPGGDNAVPFDFTLLSVKDT